MEPGEHNGTWRTQWNLENTMEPGEPIEPGEHNGTRSTQWNQENTMELREQKETRRKQWNQ